MTWNKAGYGAVLALASLLALAACGGGSGSQPFGGAKSAANELSTEAAAGASEQVQALYKQTCISCHGGNLEGRVGPATNLQKVGTKLSKEQIAKQIANGGGGMPAFGTKLKPEEVEALAAWLAEKK